MTGQEEKKKTCGKKQHVKIDIRKGMSNLICCKFTVGGNYNSTHDNYKQMFHSILNYKQEHEEIPQYHMAFQWNGKGLE